MRFWNLRKSSRYAPNVTSQFILCVSFSPSKPELVLIFQTNRRTIMDDLFIRNYIEDLLKNVRTQVLLKLIKPYTRIRIPFISKVRSRFFYFPFLFVLISFVKSYLVLFIHWKWRRRLPLSFLLVWGRGVGLLHNACRRWPLILLTQWL